MCIAILKDPSYLLPANDYYNVSWTGQTSGDCPVLPHRRRKEIVCSRAEHLRSPPLLRGRERAKSGGRMVPKLFSKNSSNKKTCAGLVLFLLCVR